MTLPPKSWSRIPNKWYFCTLLAFLPACGINSFPDDPAVDRALESLLLSCQNCDVAPGTPAVIVTPNGGAINVVEAGATDTYTIELNTEPASPVSIDIIFDGTQITVNGTTASPMTISFDSTCPGANCWSSAQTFTIAAVDDASIEANPHTSTISHTATSTDGDYSGITIDSLNVSITDNDSPGVSVVESGGSTNATEGGTDTYTVALTSAPGSPVTVTATADLQTQVNGGASATLTFDGTCPGAQCWSTPQTVTITAIDDALSEGPHTGTITHAVTSLDTDYNSLPATAVSMSITDNDSAGITATESGGNTAVTEGSTTDTYGLVLTSEPTAGVTITVNADAQTLITGGSCGAPAASCTFSFTAANWSTGQMVTVSPVDDALVEGPHSATISHSVTSGDPDYNGYALASINTSITDDDSAGITVTQSSGSTDVTEGGATDTYTLVLTSEPTGNVTITVNADAQTRVNGGSCGAPATSCTFTFTAGTWNIAQTVTISGLDDSLLEAPHNGSISHSVSSADTNYNPLTISNIAVSITDAGHGTLTVDTVTGASFYYNSIGVDGSNVYIAYYDDATDTLKFARSTDGGVTWTLSTVDNLGNVGQFNSMVVDGSGIYIAYYDFTNRDVKMAISTDGGASFSLQTVDGGGSDVGDWASLDKDGATLHLAYRNATTQRISYTQSTDSGASWNPPVDIAGTDFAGGISLDKASGGPPVVGISYFDNVNDQWEFVRSTDDGGAWDAPVVVAAGGNFPEPTSLKMDGTRAHFSYYDSVPGDLMLASSTDTGGTWATQGVDSTGDVGDYSSLALDGTNIYITYFDNTTFELKLAYSTDDGGSWNFRVIDTTGQTGTATAIVAAGTDLYVAYTTYSTDEIRFAKSNDSGVSW
ncbi:MAG: hypothetical protein RH862_15170 [Leptospiraceae bacterium]